MAVARVVKMAWRLAEKRGVYRAAKRADLLAVMRVTHLVLKSVCQSVA